MRYRSNGFAFRGKHRVRPHARPPSTPRSTDDRHWYLIRRAWLLPLSLAVASVSIASYRLLSQPALYMSETLTYIRWPWTRLSSPHRMDGSRQSWRGRPVL